MDHKDDYSYEFPYPKKKIPFENRNDLGLPNNAKLIVVYYVALEWWGKLHYRERSGKIRYDNNDENITNITGLSAQDEYNFDIGVWRALDLLDRHDINASFAVSGAGAIRHPEIMKEIVNRGHDFKGHAMYQSRGGADMTPETEQDDIIKSTEIIKRTSGIRPNGWVHPGARCTENTFRCLVDEDYLWHGSLGDDDLPYLIEVDGEHLVEIPHRTFSTNDYAAFTSPTLDSPTKGFRDPEEATEYFENVFDYYRKTALNGETVLVTMGTHPYASCTPDRVWALDNMINYVKSFSDVWVASFDEVAQWWIDNLEDSHEYVNRYN